MSYLLQMNFETGLGRTGKMFACDHESVRPDMVTMGKRLPVVSIPYRQWLPIKNSWIIPAG